MDATGKKKVDRRPLVIEERGISEAVPRSLREVLRVIGEESQRNCTDKLTSRQIDQIIKSTRAKKRRGD